MLFPASFKLALMSCSCLHHLLPWVASCSLVMHHTWLSIMSHYVLCVYHVVCFFPVLLLSSSNVAIVRIRSTTSVCLLHGLVLLPCGISGKMIILSKSLLSLLARCLLFCYAYATIPTTFLSCLPYCHVKPLNHLVLANRCLAMLPLCSAPLIALLVAGEDWRSFLVGTCLLLGYHNIILFTLMHLYTW